MLDRYLVFKMRGLSLRPFLEHHHVSFAVIFGTDDEAEKCFFELENSGVKVRAFLGVDNTESLFLGRPVISLHEARQIPRIDLAVLASKLDHPEAYADVLHILQLLRKALRVPVYTFQQMVAQTLVFDYNVRLLASPHLQGVRKYVLMHYTLGALPAHQKADDVLIRLNSILTMQDNPPAYQDIYQNTPDYGDAYIREVMFAPPLIADDRGFPVRMADRRGKHLNIVEGRRVTTDVPEDAHRTVHLLGPCMAFGYGSEDSQTLASCLQRRLNDQHAGWRVVNHSLIDHLHLEINFAYLLSKISFADGDALVYFSYSNYFLHQPCTEAYLRDRCAQNGCTYLSMFEPLKQACLSQRLFLSERHLSPAGNDLYAEQLCEAICTPAPVPAVQDLPTTDNDEMPPCPAESPSTSADEPAPPACDVYAKNPDLQAWLREIRQYRFPDGMRVGAAVMNCNPFTLGHRHLIAEALKVVDGLFVFVVEEDASRFPFRDRLELVRRGVEELHNVRVLPSGQFIISASTFGEYFNKDKPDIDHTAIDASTDVRIFCRYIAPALNISVRFVGEEPFCQVTRQYNDTMREMLPRHGLQLHVIKRLEADGAPISASRVRALLQQLEKEDDPSAACRQPETPRCIDGNGPARESAREKLKKLVPPATLDYLLRDAPATPAAGDDPSLAS